LRTDWDGSVVIVASVSCIYGLGSPADYKRMMIYLRKGETIERDRLLLKLIDIQYDRNDSAFERGRFRVRGAVVEVRPASEEFGLRITFLMMIGILITNFATGFNYAGNNFILAPTSAVSPVTPGAANAISGIVVNDLNGNGMFNGGKPGLAGATLTLVSNSGVSYGTMVTSPSGTFTT